MKNKIIKRFILFILIVILSIQLKDIFLGENDQSLFYYVFGMYNDVNVIVLLKWYFGLCITYMYISGYFKQEVSNHRLNAIVRCKTKLKYCNRTIGRGILKAIFIWCSITISCGLLRNGIKGTLTIKSLQVLFVTILVIIVLTTLLILLEVLISPIYSFIMVNVFTLISLGYGLKKSVGILNIVMIPNFLMGYRIEQFNYGLIIGTLIGWECILIILYQKVCKKIDIIG